MKNRANKSLFFIEAPPAPLQFESGQQVQTAPGQGFVPGLWFSLRTMKMTAPESARSTVCNIKSREDRSGGGYRTAKRRAHSPFCQLHYPDNEVLCRAFLTTTARGMRSCPERKRAYLFQFGVSVTVPAGAVKTNSPPSEEAVAVLVVEPTLTVQVPALTPET